MKRILSILLLVFSIGALQAQPASPAYQGDEERAAAIRRLLDNAYYDLSRTSPPPVSITGVPLPSVSRQLNDRSQPEVAAPDEMPPAAPAPLTNRFLPTTNAVVVPGTNSVVQPSAAPPGITPRVPPAPGAPAPSAQVPPVAPPRPQLPGVPPVPVPAPGAPATQPTAEAARTRTIQAVNGQVEPSGDDVLAPGVIKFQEADLLQVLDVYQELTGRTILRPTALPAQKISIRSQTPLTRKEAVQALDSILALNGVTMIPQGEKFVKAVPFSQASQEAGEFTALSSDIYPESSSYVTHVVSLSNTVPSQIIQALQPFAKLPNSILAIDSSGIIVLRDYAENVKRMLELIEQIDVVPIQEYKPILIPIKYALAADIAQVLSSLTSGGGATTVGGQPTRTGLTPPAGLSGTPGGYQPPGGQTTGGLGSQTGTRSSFQERLRNIVSRAAQGEIQVLGETQIIADERTNSLLIFASAADITTITQIIAKLDVVLPQVIIEAIILEVSLGNELNYGISYLQRQPTQIGDYVTGIGALRNIPFLTPGAFGALGSNALGGGFSYFAGFGNDFEATATAIASDSRINVLSRPRIQTSHAVEANLFVGRTRPYVTGTYFGFSGQPQTQFQQQQIGITLSVLPLINPEGLVVLDIRQKIQSIGREIQVDPNFSVPETIDREANAKVAVRDQETVMLGGFISEDNERSKSGIPILKDIPVLGNLFRSTNRDKSRNELIVLIRPTVLPTPEEAALVATQERHKLPGIIQAEQDMLRDEEKRIEKMRKEMRTNPERYRSPY